MIIFRWLYHLLGGDLVLAGAIGLGVSMLMGLVLVPLLIYARVTGLSKGLGQGLGRLHVLLSMFAFRKQMGLLHRDAGTYELVPLRVYHDERQDEEVLQAYVDGTWIDVEQDGNDLQRFAGGWFCELDERGSGDLYAHETPALTDGGTWMRRITFGRGDEAWLYNPFPDPEGVLVDLDRLWKRLKGQNAGEFAKAGFNDGLEEGGYSGPKSALFWLLLSFGGIIVGFVCGVIILLIGTL